MDYNTLKSILRDNEVRETRQAIKENAARMQAIEEETEINDIWNRIYKNHSAITDLSRFKANLTEAFVTEGLTIFVDNCLNPVLVREEYNQKLVRQLVSNFVKAEGATNLLNKMKRTSYMLSELAYVTDQTIQAVFEKADKKNDESFRIDKEDKEQFYQKLSKIDVDESVGKITERVKQQTTDFINSNMEEKVRMEEVLNKTQNKVDKNKEKLSGKENDPNAVDKAQKLEAAYISQGKRAITDLTNSRTKNVFEHLVYTLSKIAMVNESAKEVFVTDNRLNMDKVVEHCEVLCTFLTAMDSIKLMNVDENYIHDMLEDMKK